MAELLDALIDGIDFEAGYLRSEANGAHREGDMTAFRVLEAMALGRYLLLDQLKQAQESIERRATSHQLDGDPPPALER